MDTLTFRVSLNQQREAYQLVGRNQNSSHQSVKSINGSTTKGEFGSALRLICDRESAAVFEPQKPEQLPRRVLAVYKYARAPGKLALSLGIRPISDSDRLPRAGLY